MPASIHSGNITTSRTNITSWAVFHRRGPSTTRTFISPSAVRYTDPPPLPPSQPYWARPSRPHRRRKPGPVPVANRAVIITCLDHDVTVTELLQSIARTAPVGAISSALLLPLQPVDAYYRDPRSRWPPARGDRLAAGAKVSFNRRDDAIEFIRLAREKVFRVRNRTPYVAEDRSRARSGAPVPPPSMDQYLHTRVLVLEGPPGTRGFDEATIRRVLRSDEKAMSDAGPFGDLSEPVITTLLGNGLRRMEWRFFSYALQAMPFKKVIRAHFVSRLSVRHGRDPCCPMEVWEEERRRNRERVRDCPHGKKARQDQLNRESPIEARVGEGNGESYQSPTKAPKLDFGYFQEEGREASLEGSIPAWQPSTENIAKSKTRLDQAIMALKTASKPVTEATTNQGLEHVWSDHLEDRTVTRQTDAEQTTETVAVQSSEPIGKEDLQEHVADETVTPQTIVEQAVEQAIEAATLEHGREEIGVGGHLETATESQETTIEQSNEVHAQQDSEHIKKDVDVKVGAMSQEITIEQTTEATADPMQDRKSVDGEGGVVSEQLSLQLIPVEGEVVADSSVHPGSPPAEP